jgi:ATP-dependent Clp protease ATP-binding subunit ClpA
MTTDALAVIADIPQHAWAADRREMTLWDLAAALAVPSGNTADIWPATAPETPASDSGIASTVPPASGPGPYLRFDREVRAVLEQALAVALQQRAEHLGTEHLLAALVRTGPADVVAWLGTRGATAEAVDALLAGLNGGPGVEHLAAELSRTDRRRWRRATAREHGDWQPPRALATVAVVLAVIVVFALCIWGP